LKPESKDEVCYQFLFCLSLLFDDGAVVNGFGCAHHARARGSPSSSSQAAAFTSVKQSTRLHFFSNPKTVTEEQAEVANIDTDDTNFFIQSLQKKVTSEDKVTGATETSENAYVQFAKENPSINNIMIATVKTAGADFLAQTAFGSEAFDVERSLLFALFGAVYLGAFQYLYQVNIFKKIFDVDKFTSQSWSDKMKDVPGLKALAAQTGLDLTVLTLVYLPTFYIFKASVFSGSMDPSVWFSSGISTYQANFSSDETDLIKVWLPADLVCFSVPLYLRLPVRHVVSFVWTAYLSFARGGHY
jgi:hypothetical protein